MKTAQIIDLDDDDPQSELVLASPFRPSVDVRRLRDTPSDEISAPRETARSVQRNVVDLPRFLPLRHRPSEFFAAVQEWEGVVKEVGPDGFSAELSDVAGHADGPSEVATISFEDIDPIDRPKVVRGAIFRWLIGRSRTRAGTASRKWVIYFRRAARAPTGRSPFDGIELPPRLKEKTKEVAGIESNTVV